MTREGEAIPLEEMHDYHLRNAQAILGPWSRGERRPEKKAELKRWLKRFRREVRRRVKKRGR